MSDIAKARELIREATGILNEAVNLMHREKIKPVKAPPKSKPMDKEIVCEIIRLVYAVPEMSNQEIANRVGVNSGRVTETIKKHMDLMSSLR